MTRCLPNAHTTPPTNSNATNAKCDPTPTNHSIKKNNRDVDHAAGFFKTHLPIPAVVPCNSARELLAAVRATPRPVVCLLQRPRVDLAADPAAGWPPPGGLRAAAGTFLVLHGSHGAHVHAYPAAGAEPPPSESPAHDFLPRRRRLLNEARGNASVAGGGSASVVDGDGVVGPGETGAVAVEVPLGFAAPLFAVEAGADGGGDAAPVELQSLRLTQLAQGPGARAAASVADPSVWALMLWAFHRTAPRALNMTDVELELPAREYAELKRLRGGRGDFTLFLQGEGQRRTEGGREERKGGSEGRCISTEPAIDAIFDLRRGQLT